MYIGNVLKDISEEKFRKINPENEAFKKRVGKISGGLPLLKGAGFHEIEDGTLYMDHVDEGLLREALDIL